MRGIGGLRLRLLRCSCSWLIGGTPSAIIAANNAIGAALRCVLAEGIGIDRAASLVDMDPDEVRRLVRLRASADSDAVGNEREAGSAATSISI